MNMDEVHAYAAACAGRRLRGGLYKQADVRRDWALWLLENGCNTTPDKRAEISGRLCDTWSGCGKPKTLSFCTHDGGHNIHAGDLEALWQLATGMRAP